MSWQEDWNCLEADEFRVVAEYSWEKFSQDEPDEPENLWFPEEEAEIDDCMSTHDPDDYENRQQF